MWGSTTSLVTTQVRLEDIVLTEIRQAQKDKPCTILLMMWNLPKWSPEAEREWQSPEADRKRKMGMRKCGNFSLEGGQFPSPDSS